MTVQRISLNVEIDPIDFLNTIAQQNPEIILAYKRRESFASWGPAACASCPAEPYAAPMPEAQWIRDAAIYMKADLKIEAIKTIRSNTPLGLKEAKDVADTVQNSGNIYYNEARGSYVSLSPYSWDLVERIVKEMQ